MHCTHTYLQENLDLALILGNCAFKPCAKSNAALLGIMHNDSSDCFCGSAFFDSLQMVKLSRTTQAIAQQTVGKQTYEL